MESTQSAVLNSNVEEDKNRVSSVSSPIDSDLESSPHLKKPWEYRSAYGPGETVKAHERLMYYLSLGQGRTLTKVSEHFGLRLPNVSVMAKKNQWKTRAAAWDEYEALRKAEEERESRHNEHMQKLSEFRDRSETVGTAMITSAARLLQAANKTLSRMQAADEELDRKLLASVLQASARVAESGRILMSQSLGVDALMAGLDGAEGDGDEYT